MINIKIQIADHFYENKTFPNNDNLSNHVWAEARCGLRHDIEQAIDYNIKIPIKGVIKGL